MLGGTPSAAYGIQGMGLAQTGEIRAAGVGENGNGTSGQGGAMGQGNEGDMGTL